MTGDVRGDAIVDELAWRGLIAQTTDEAALRRDLASGPMTLYCGFDPTAESLHAGNLLQLITLRRFQLAGHRPIVLAGGATGLIGDPSGRSSERDFVTREQIAARVEDIRPQLERFVDLDGGSAILVWEDRRVLLSRSEKEDACSFVAPTFCGPPAS